MDIEAEYMGAIERGLDKACEKGLIKAVELSSGTFSLADLARMGHPFSAANPQPFPPAQIINAQTGAFRDDWRKGPTRQFGSVVEGCIRNDNPVADYLQYGTRIMVKRPVKDELEQFLEGEIERCIEAELDRTFGKELLIA